MPPPAMDRNLGYLDILDHRPGEPVAAMMGRVLARARALTGAEAGSIFILRDNRGGATLDAASVQNDTVPVGPESFSVPVDGKSIAGHIARTSETLFIDDMRTVAAGAPWRFDASWDQRHGFETRSMLAFALTNYDGKVVGVVQLINGPDAQGRARPFDRAQADLILPFNRVVGAAVERADLLERIGRQNERLRQRNRKLRSQKIEIAALRDATEDAFQLSIELLARAAEIHDEGTGNHIVRVNEYAWFIARTLALPAPFCAEIRYSAQLHDVGKMAVDQAVLKKKGRLDEVERLEMNNHTLYGQRILEQSDRLKMAAEIALAHHEKWDGTGYPHGLAGEDIPLSARITQLADVYDALRSERPYKPAFDHERTRRIILEGDDRLDSKGTFDPRILEAFADTHADFDRIWIELHDRTADGA
ncbi:MAG: HD domain-containing phosphohydrolase [Alphaproteobacteria bacterium]